MTPVRISGFKLIWRENSSHWQLYRHVVLFQCFAGLSHEVAGTDNLLHLACVAYFCFQPDANNRAPVQGQPQYKYKRGYFHEYSPKLYCWALAGSPSRCPARARNDYRQTGPRSGDQFKAVSCRGTAGIHRNLSVCPRLHRAGSDNARDHQFPGEIAISADYGDNHAAWCRPRDLAVDGHFDH